jgi:hypothetical protein
MRACYGIDTPHVIKAIVDWSSKLDIPSRAAAEEKTENDLRLTTRDFAALFGTSEEDIPDDCRELILGQDFRYKRLSPAERDGVLLGILKTIDSDKLNIAGKGKKPIWEKGWNENLQEFVGSEYDLNAIVPKYYRPSEVLRINREYARVADGGFEFNFFRVLRLWLFRKYLRDMENVYEFGCGPGHNLVEIARLFPEKNLFGLDWASASKQLVDKIGEVYGHRMKGYAFDMFDPAYDIRLGANSAALTIGSLEQIGEKHEEFLQFLLANSPTLCINIEPIAEFYDSNNLLDYLAIKYQDKRHYLTGYLSRLKELEEAGRVEIIKTQRMSFGNLNYDGWSFIVWRPLAQ